MKRVDKTPIEVGLLVAARLMRPGDSLSQTEIADICGCSKMFICMVEQRALRKVRKQLKELGIGLPEHD